MNPSSNINQPNPILPKKLEPSSEPISVEKKIKKEEIKKTVSKRLPPSPEMPKKKSEGGGGGGFWSWFEFSGAKEKKKGSGEESTDLQEKEPQKEAIGSQKILSESSEVNEESSFPTSPTPEFEQTTIKSYQVGQQTFFGWLGKKAVENVLWVAAPLIKKIAGSIESGMNKENVIAEQKSVMKDELGDPQFVEFYELVSGALIPMIDSEALSSLEKQTDSLSKIVSSNRSSILKLMEVVVARGFANLARQVKAEKDNIPNFDKQPTLVSVISLLGQKAGKDINLESLGEIEKKYRKDREDLVAHLNKLFPGVDKRPSEEESLQKYIQEYISSVDSNRKKTIKHTLFPNLDAINGEKLKEIEGFFTTLDRLHAKNRELNQLFSKVTDSILLYFFPNKLKDIPEIPNRLRYFFEGYVFKKINGVVTDLLQKSYEPLENDTVRNGEWEKDLRVRTGGVDLKPVIEAPSTLLNAVVKNYIEGDRGAIKFVAKTIEGFVKPKEEGGNKLGTEENSQVLDNLSHVMLADWLLKSVQSLLSSQDPQLSGFGTFMSQAMNNLALALMSKGAKAVIEEGKQVEENEFIKVFIDSLLDKIVSLKGDEMISEELVRQFLRDLPIPPLSQKILVPLLTEKGKSLQEELKKKIPELQGVQKVFAEAGDKILQFDQGEKLLAIADEVSNQIIEQVVGRNFDLVSALDLTDTVDDLLSQYLPGIKVDDNLKGWFKKNISAFGLPKDDGDSSGGMLLLKQGIQAFLRKAMVDVIERNFKKDGKNYAAQLFDRIQNAFSKAFLTFDESQKKELNHALDIQGEITGKKEKIAKIKKEASDKPKGISHEQELLIEAALSANSNVARIGSAVKSLAKKQDELLLQLNKKSQRTWQENELSLVKNAMMLRKIEEPTFISPQGYIEALEIEFAPSDSLLGLDLPKDDLKDRETRIILLEILKMPVEDLKVLSEAVQANATLESAKKKQERLEGELEEKIAVVNNYDKNKIQSPLDWKAAIERMDLLMKGKGEIERLSQEIGDLEKQLDLHLGEFQLLAGELMGLLGLEKPEQLDLPDFLKDHVWPLIQSAKNQQIARLLFTQVTPLLLVVQERDKNRSLLEEKSGSPLLGHLSEALAKDLIAMAPKSVKSYHPIAEKVLKVFSGSVKPDPKKIDQLAVAIKDLVKQKNVKNHSLIEAFEKIKGKPLSRKEKLNFKKALKQQRIKEEIKAILLTPEEISSEIGKLIPNFDEKLQFGLANQLQQFLHDSSDSYQIGADAVRTYVEGVLLKMFINVAEKNPKQQGKDTIFVITEKLLNAATEQFNKVSSGKKFEEVAKGLPDFIMKDVLGIDSPKALQGIPEPLREKVYSAVQDKLKGLLDLVQNSLINLDVDTGAVSIAKQNVKKFGIREGASKGYVQILTEKLAVLAVGAVPDMLDEISGDKGKSQVFKKIETYLEKLTAGNIELAKVLLQHAKGDQFQQMIGGNIDLLAEKVKAAGGKQHASHFLSNLLIVPLSQVIDKAVNFEKVHEEQFNQKLMANFFRVGASHLKNLNQAKALALKNGRKEIQYRDFVEAGGGKLHPGVSKTGTVDESQRLNEAFGPAAKSIMNMVFPNGKEDLTFVVPELRDTVWKMFKTNLLPQVLPMLTEVILDPRTINNIVLSSLEIAKEKLEEEVVLSPPETYDPSHDELDEAAGDLFAETIKSTVLPSWIKKRLIDSKTGEMTPEMKKTLGAALRRQFNNTFIQDKLKIAMEKAVNKFQQIEEGEAGFSVDVPGQKRVDPVKEAKKMQADLKRVSRQVVDLSISYYIRMKWKAAQARFDRAVAKILGKGGSLLKKGLDAMFRFLFFHDCRLHPFRPFLALEAARQANHL